MAVMMGIYSHVTDSMKERAAKRSNAELKAALGGKFEGLGGRRAANCLSVDGSGLLSD
jgi:hypothetical protein